MPILTIFQRGESRMVANIIFRKVPQDIQNFNCIKVPLKKFPVEKGNYILGNEYSPVAVVIPRGNHNLIKIAVESGAAIAGHLVTANIGIEKIIANIVSNPNIRYLILFGVESEGHLAAQSLLSLYKNGIDENGRIIGSAGMTPYIRNLPKEAVERFRAQIRCVINLIGEEDPKLLRRTITACIQEPKNAIEMTLNNESHILYDPGALDVEPIVLQITEKLKYSGIYETLSLFSTVIHASTISAAYPLLIEAILSAGVDIEDERGTKTKELLNVQVHILKPQEEPIPKGYRPEGWLKTDEEVAKYLEKYAETYFQSNATVVYEEGEIMLKQSEVAYTYGDRITNFDGINQLNILAEAIKSAIRKNEPSRRFVMSLFNPKIDLMEETEKMEIPCFTQFWVYNRRKNGNWTLHATMFLRSHDAYLAFPANSYAGMKILEHLCNKTGAKIGSLTMYFGSAHIYINE